MKSENGRSMVEMLGVLAIIGVLSVGAISGYSKAMFKYKLNKQTEQINQIIGAMVRYKNDITVPAVSGREYTDIRLVPILKKLGEIPQEMYISSSETYIKDSFGTRYRVYQRSNNTYITLRTTNLPRTENGFQTCKNLYLIAKEWHDELHLIETIAYKGSKFIALALYVGDKYCTGSYKCLKDLKLTEFDDICRTAAEEEGADYSIAIQFK